MLGVGGKLVISAITIPLDIGQIEKYTRFPVVYRPVCSISIYKTFYLRIFNVSFYI